MKIIHCADLHIGVETYGSIDAATGLNTRVLDELRALDAVIRYAIKVKADVVVFCGDVYKNREPSPTYQREFARRVLRLSEAKIPLVIVPGNHDLPGNDSKANSVDIFGVLQVDHVYIAEVASTFSIKTKSGMLQVGCLPWRRRFQQDAESINTVLADIAQSIDPGYPAILAAHAAVSGSVAGTEKGMSIGTDPVIPLILIANPVYDYVALGHIHRRQVLSENPPVVYSGSLERLDFGDEGDEKGFYEVDIEPGPAPRKVSYQFHPIEARKFLTLDFEVKEGAAPDPTGDVLAAISVRADDLRDAIVRIKISIPESMKGLLRESEIVRALKPAYSVKFAIEIQRTARARAASWAGKSMTPIEALDKYMEINGVIAERSIKLREYAEKLIEVAA
jgi:DNA repair protein SbcD/Mre11